MSFDPDLISAEVKAAIASINPETAQLTYKGAWSSTGKDATRGADTVASISLIFSAWSQRQVDGTAIRVGDLKAMIAAEGLPQRPRVGDTLAYQGITYALVPPVTSLAPTGQPLYYQVNLREVS